MEKILMTGTQDISLHQIKEKALGTTNEIMQVQIELKKKRKKRKSNDSCLDESSQSDDEATGYFRDKRDLKYANLEWRDIKQTTLGRKIDEKLNMLLRDRKNL